MNKVKPVLFTILVSVLLSFAVVFPIFRLGKNGIFYSIDPDVVYVANTLSYIKSGVIGYYDHPGTVAITWLSYSYLPLRIYTKLIAHQNFISWSFTNFGQLFVYSRLFQNLLFTLGYSIFGWSILKITKSYLSQLISMLLLFGFLPVYYLSGAISADTSAFFIASIWFYLFTNFYISKNQIWVYLLFLLSGFMFADRATDFFYMGLPFLFILSEKIDLISKIKRSIFGFTFLLIGYYLGIYPLKGQIMDMFMRILFFAGSSEVHGGGNFLNLSSYMEALRSFAYRDPFAVLVFAVTLLISINSLRTKERLIGMVGIVASFGALIFAKLPLAHYQIPNYMLLTFVVTYFSSRLNSIGKLLIISAIVIAISPVAKEYYKEIIASTSKEAVLESFIQTHGSQKPTLWVWGRSKDFALLWVRDWGGGIFDKELENSNKNYEFDPATDKIKLNASKTIGLARFCWGQLYVQKEPLKIFLQKNPLAKVSSYEIPGSDDMSILYNHNCR